MGSFEWSVLFIKGPTNSKQNKKLVLTFIEKLIDFNDEEIVKSIVTVSS